MCKCPRILPRNLTTENNLIVDFHIFLAMYLLFMVIGKLTLVQSFTFFASKCRIPLVINDASLLIFFIEHISLFLLLPSVYIKNGKLHLPIIYRNAGFY